jgi:raffinose/stachyose/melibiose transport system permease protein
MKKSLKKYFPIFVLPTLLAFLISFVIPFFLGIYLSFTKFTTVTNSKWVGLKNYKNIFINNNFVHSLIFTALFALVSVVTINLFAFAIAYALTRGIRGSYFFRTIFFMPNLIGGIVLGYIWQLILNGILYNYQLTLTSDGKFGFWGLVILMNWQMIGYNMVIYIAGLQNIPLELIEAAKVDGASPSKILFNVSIPLMMPSFTINLFITLTNSFKLFDQNLALTAGAPGTDSAMLALDIFNTFYGRMGWEGVGQAKAVIFFLIVAVLSFAQLSLTRKREVES